MSNSKFGRIISVATAAFVILLGIAYITCTAVLYYTGGDTPYSRESVNSYLAWLLIPSVITVALAVTGVIYNSTSKENDNKMPGRTSRELYDSYISRYELDSFSPSALSRVSAFDKQQKIFDLCASFVSSTLFVLILDYLIFIAEFSVESLSSDVMTAFAVVLPLAAIGVAVHIPRVYAEEVCYGQMLAALKESVKEGCAPRKATAAVKESNKPTNIARYTILAVAILLIVLGVFNDGVTDVLQKAVKICTECIGLG